MPETTYLPGDANGIVTPHGLALVTADLEPELLSRIWRQLDEGRGLAAVLEALTGAFGTSLAAIPPFAVVVREGDAVRVAARGAVSIAVETPSGVDTVSGHGVTTWSERVFAAAARASVRLGDASEGAGSALPLRDGVVRARAIAVDWSGAGPRDAAVARVAGAPVTPQPVPAPSAPSASVSAPSAGTSAPSAPPSAPSASLIDSTAVLSVSTADTLLPQDSTLAAAPAHADTEGTTGYDHLWGATVVRSVEDAAVREDEEDAAAAAPQAGDHDGETISVAQARALRPPVEPAEPPSDSAPPPLAPPRLPAVGRLRLSNGQVVLLDRTVVIGRRPRSTRVTGTDLPHLVAVDSPQQDISRSHVEVRTEGDSILVTDLHTTNGTTLLRSGADPVRLHPGERTVVVPGDVIDLGDGITATVEDLA